MTFETLSQQIMKRSQITQEYANEVANQLLALPGKETLTTLRQLATTEPASDDPKVKELMTLLGSNEDLYARIKNLVVSDES